jgi:hypothetical protein
MSSYELYKLYLAIKLHFTVPSYDVFLTNGAVKGVTEESFNKKGLRYRFNALSSQLKNTREAVDYFVACFAYGVDFFNASDADEARVRWRRNKEMTTQLILDDIDQLTLPKDVVGKSCRLQSLLQGKVLNIETGVALNNRYNFADDWLNFNFVYSGLGSKIKKLTKFVKYNEDKVNKFISEHEQQETTIV